MPLAADLQSAASDHPAAGLRTRREHLASLAADPQSAASDCLTAGLQIRRERKGAGCGVIFLIFIKSSGSGTETNGKHQISNAKPFGISHLVLEVFSLYLSR